MSPSRRGSERSESVSSSTPKVKKTRKKTQGVSLPTNYKLRVEFNPLGQPCGFNASKFNTFLAVNVKKNARISYLFWEKVPEENKKEIYKNIVDNFEFVETPLIRESIHKKMGKKFNDFKYQIKKEHFTDEDPELRRNNIPEGMKEEDWHAFVDHCEKDEVQEEAARNKGNRSQQVLIRRTGSKSFAQIRAEKAEKDPEHREPTQWQMFLHSYTRSDGTSCSAAEEIMGKFEVLAAEDESSSVNEDSIYHKIVGLDRHGRVRGYGYGPTPSSVFGSDPGRAELETELAEAHKQNEVVNAKLEEMKLQMKEETKKKDDDMKALREDISRLKEQNQRMEMFVSKFMSNMGQVSDCGSYCGSYLAGPNAESSL